MIVSVSGVDCSGKSTQLDLLEKAFAAGGRRVRRAWFRPGYSDELVALKRLVRRLRPGALPAAGRSEAREKVFARAGVSEAWVAMAALDTVLTFGVKARAWSLRGEVVLFDRYVEDALLDLRLGFGPLLGALPALPALLRAAAPTPDAALLLMVPRPVMLARMEAKQEPFPDPPETRDARYAAYAALAAGPGFEVVDAEGPVEVVHARVMAALARRGLLA